jgi:hypothetical protein
MTAAQNYLRDVLPELIRRAQEAKRESTVAAAGTSEAHFAAGRRTAYYEVVATMLGELNAFGIPRKVIGVSEEFDAERDLL